MTADLKLYHFDCGTWGMVKTVATLVHTETFTLEQLQGFAVDLVDEQIKAVSAKLTDEFGVPFDVIAGFGFKNPDYGASYRRFIDDFTMYILEKMPSSEAHLQVKQHFDQRYRSREWPQLPDYLIAKHGFSEPPVILNYNLGS